jgi:sialate O-acetylesterase
VLQQGVTIPVWGTASPGEKITVRLDDKEVSTMTGRDGKWTVQLPPQVGGGPHTMTIAGTTNKVTATNVLTGEVWVSAGQSNMAFDLKKVTGASNEISKADYPTLRAFRVSSKGYALPQETLPRGEWVECSPNTAGSFSAVGYYFARDLIKARRVPVGLIETAWSGTPAEAWTGLDGLSNEKELRHYADTAAKLAAEYPGKMRDLPRQFSHYWA